MRTVVYSARSYDQNYLERANKGKHELHFYPARINNLTVSLAQGSPAICCFVDDILDTKIIQTLREQGTRLIVLRATGFNNIDLKSADKNNITVMRVSRYSPYAIAEFVVGIILNLDRKIHRAYNRVREGNFLLDGLLGFDLHGKTIGIIGTGKIGSVLAEIMHGFGCNLLGNDNVENPDCLRLGMKYVPINDLLQKSDIVSLHIPLTPETYHIINSCTLSFMKQGAILINTSRGELVDAQALILALKDNQIGAVGLDVYEEESDIYFQDLSDKIISDDIITRLMTFPNVIITGHQAFFTHEAMVTIAETTIRNITDFSEGRTNENTLNSKKILPRLSAKASM